MIISKIPHFGGAGALRESGRGIGSDTERDPTIVGRSKRRSIGLPGLSNKGRGEERNR